MNLVSLALLLRPLRQAEPDKPLPHWWGRAAHRLLLDTLNTSDEQLSEAAHEGSELRPFTTSTLYGNYPDHRLDLQGNYLLRFTGLSQAVSTSLIQAVQTGGSLATDSIVNMDYLDFKVQAVYCETGTHLLADQTTYQELATASLLNTEPASYQVDFSFVSPTTFHSRGRQMPFPVPDLVINSLLDRWNAFAPIAFPEDARRYASECLALSRFDVKSRRVTVAGGTQAGFIGRVTFSALTYDRYWMSLMQTLARFSFYSGVGVKTTMGMGQCRRVVDTPKKIELTKATQ